MKNPSALSYVNVCLCLVLLLSTVSCIRDREKPHVARQTTEDIATETTLLATIANNEKPPKATPGHTQASSAQNQPPSFQVVFSESGRGVAYIVAKGSNVSVVHNQRRGKEYAAVGPIVLSPNGQRIAYAARAAGKWCMVVDGEEGRSYDTLLTPVFSPDGQHVMYQAKEGDTWYLVVDNRQNGGTMASYTTPEFSSDSAKIVFVEAADSNSEMKLIVSDLTFGTQNIKRSIGDLLFTTNSDKTRIAAAEVVGNKLRIIDFSFAEPDIVHTGPLYDVIEKLTFGDDGVSVSYCALNGRTRLLVLDNREEPLPSGVLPELPVVRPDKKGVGLLLAGQNHVRLHQSFFNNTETGTMYDEAANLVYSKDARFHAYAARKGRNWFVVVNGKKGPPFDRVVTPLFSPDSKYLVYRARKNGKRFVVVADTSGETIKVHPSYEQVHQAVITPDGKSVAYGVKDGRRLIWKVEKLVN